MSPRAGQVAVPAMVPLRVMPLHREVVSLPAVCHTLVASAG